MPKWFIWPIAALVLAGVLWLILRKPGAQPYWDRYGYEGFESPRDYIRPGAIVTYEDGMEYLEAAEDVCFPDTVRRVHGREQFLTRDKELSEDLSLLGSFLPTEKPSEALHADLKANQVTRVVINIPAADVELIERVKVRDVVNNPDLSAECADALAHGTVIITQVVTPPFASFRFMQAGGTGLDISLLRLRAGARYRWEDRETLVVEESLSVAYKAAPIAQLQETREASALLDELPAELLAQLKQTDSESWLVAAGLFDPENPVILSDFDSRARDASLALAATEAFRVNVSESPTVTLLETERLARLLSPRQRRRTTALDLPTAIGLARDQGVETVITGRLSRGDPGYVVSAELVSAMTGEPVSSYSELAADTDQLIPAVDLLTRRLRGSLGDPLEQIRKTKPLELATTGSLDVWSTYTEAVRAIDVRGDLDKGIALLQEAISIDSSFALAYRKLGVALRNLQQRRQEVVEMLSKAFEYMERLPEREQLLTEGTYYQLVTQELDSAANAYESLLEKWSDDVRALNNLAVVYFELRDYPRAETLARRAIDVDSSNADAYANVIDLQVAQGKFDAAYTTLQQLAEKFPQHAYVPDYAAALASARGDYESARAFARALKISRPDDPNLQASADVALAALASLEGRLQVAEALLREAIERYESRELGAEYLRGAITLGLLDIRLQDAQAQGLATVRDALEQHPLGTIDPLDRPYLELASFYAETGSPGRARTLLGEYDSARDTLLRMAREPLYHAALGSVALAEGRIDEALREVRLWDGKTGCAICALPLLGQVHELAGEPDSAIAVYERYVTTPWLFRIMPWPVWRWHDPYHLGRIFERLAALYANRGQNKQAIQYLDRLRQLWKDADPPLQSRVEAARHVVEAAGEESGIS